MGTTEQINAPLGSERDYEEHCERFHADHIEEMARKASGGDLSEPGDDTADLYAPEPYVFSETSGFVRAFNDLEGDPNMGQDTEYDPEIEYDTDPASIFYREEPTELDEWMEDLQEGLIGRPSVRDRDPAGTSHCPHSDI